VSELEESKVLRGDAVLADPLVSELVGARLVGVLATFDPARVIHAVPMWYAPHDGTVLFATSSSSRKVRNLARDSRATLLLHDSRPGYEVCGASIVGTIEVVHAPEARELIDLVQGRYVAVEAAVDDPTALSFLQSDDVALRLTPSSAFTWDHRASEGSRILRAHGWARPLVTTDPRA
jgi:nitroimidazol reductase NimA-like FMN-containing flavoprotein (pyridoxamine 5'-phosphate oxidase superfamily)